MGRVTDTESIDFASKALRCRVMSEMGLAVGRIDA